MTPESNIDLVRNAYQAYARRDLAAAFSVMHPDIEIEQTPELPWGGHHQGGEAAMSFFAKIASATDATPEIESFIPAGDAVAAVGRLRGKARETGNPIDLAIVHIWTIRDGKVVRFQAYIDTPAMKTALGLIS